MGTLASARTVRQKIVRTMGHVIARQVSVCVLFHSLVTLVRSCPVQTTVLETASVTTRMGSVFATTAGNRSIAVSLCAPVRLKDVYATTMVFVMMPMESAIVIQVGLAQGAQRLLEQSVPKIAAILLMENVSKTNVSVSPGGLGRRAPFQMKTVQRLMIVSATLMELAFVECATVSTAGLV